MTKVKDVYIYFPSIIDELKESNFIECYDFVDEKHKLCAMVDQKTGKQQLMMYKLNKDNEVIKTDSISCIHTAVCDISPQQYDELEHNEELKDKLLKTYSLENRIEINLAPQEKFFAFTSWVQGIAEQGLNALQLQTDIEDLAQFITPISDPLRDFILEDNVEAIKNYIDLIKKQCQFEGKTHDACLIANLDPLIRDYANNMDVLGIIFSTHVPIKSLSINSHNLYHPHTITSENIPQSISQLDNLEELSINSVDLDFFPDAFSKLNNLKELDIAANHIDNPFPSKLYNIKQIKKLTIGRYGDICGISTLENLEELSLLYNGCMCINELLNLKNLKSLRIEHLSCPFQHYSIPAQLIDNPNLQTILLDKSVKVDKNFQLKLSELDPKRPFLFSQDLN